MLPIFSDEKKITFNKHTGMTKMARTPETKKKALDTTTKKRMKKYKNIHFIISARRGEKIFPSSMNVSCPEYKIMKCLTEEKCKKN